MAAAHIGHVAEPEQMKMTRAAAAMYAASGCCGRTGGGRRMMRQRGRFGNAGQAGRCARSCIFRGLPSNSLTRNVDGIPWPSTSPKASQLYGEANAAVETLSVEGCDPSCTATKASPRRHPRSARTGARRPGAWRLPLHARYAGILIDRRAPTHKPKFQEDKKFVFFCAADCVGAGGQDGE